MLNKIFLGVAGLALIIFGIYLFVSRWKVVETTTPEPTPVYSPVPESASFNFLFLGSGGAGHDGGGLTDSMIVVHVNTTDKKAALISIPRDLWVPGITDKINSALVKNSDVKDLVSEITNLPINYYVAVDFGSFVKLVDTLGKIEVNVPQTFEDKFFPIKGKENDLCGKTEEEVWALKSKYTGFDLEKQFTCRYETIHYEKGLVQMDGSAALKFVRSRHSNVAGGDFARSSRQFAVLAGILDKLISFSTIEKISPIIDSLRKIVKADLGKDQILVLIEKFGDPKSYSVKEIHITDENLLTNKVGPGGQFILVPRSGQGNWSTVQKYIESELSRP